MSFCVHVVRRRQEWFFDHGRIGASVESDTHGHESTTSDEKSTNNYETVRPRWGWPHRSRRICKVLGGHVVGQQVVLVVVFFWLINVLFFVCVVQEIIAEKFPNILFPNYGKKK